MRSSMQWVFGPATGRALVALLAVALVASCGKKKEDEDADTDTSTDTFTDVDADAVTDTEPDPDAVEDPDSEADAVTDPDVEADAEADAVDPYCVPRTGSLTFTGLDADGEGCAAWNTAAGAPEAEETGHAITWAPTCVVQAYYYIASRDYVDSTATAGIHVTGATAGFTAFQASLVTAGLTLADVEASWTVGSLGGDVEGTDWSYETTSTVETRLYTGGTLSLTLDGEPLVSGPMPDLTVLATYNTVSDCLDDEIGGSTAHVLLSDASSGSSAPVRAAAAAFLEDVGGFGVRFAFDSLQPIGITEFTSDNRTGAYMEAQTGTIEIGDTAISAECD